MLFVNLLIFLILTFLIIYIPGIFFLSKTDFLIKTKKSLSGEETVALAFSLGIVLFVLISVILGILHLRFLILPLSLILSLITIIRFNKSIFVPWDFIFRNKILLSLLFFGILVQGFISFPSGYQYQEGLFFWSSQAFDGFWHISIMEEIKKNFPPEMPVFSGEQLINYHYLSDVLMGEFGRIFPFFSSLDLYFRFFPIIFSGLMGLSVFAFVQRWKNKKIAYWAVFFTYFCGSFGYIVTLLRNGKVFGGETVFWAAQLNTVIANPPHAVAISLLTSFLLSFLIFLQTRKISWFYISLLCALVISGFKVSSGIVLLAGLAIAALLDIIINRKFSVLYLLIILSISNFITIKLMTRGVETYLIFSPWWFVRAMVVEKLGLLDWELRRQHYLSKGTWTAALRVLQLELTAFFIFLIGNIGMRVIGFIAVFKQIILKKDRIYSKPFEAGIFIMMITAFLIPLFFLQKGIATNTIQFLQYFLLLAGLFAAITTVEILKLIKNKFLKMAFLIFIVLFSVPTVVGNFVEFYGSGKPMTIVTSKELQALQYLKTHSNQNDTILTPVFDQYLKLNYSSRPLPIYAWDSTGYVSGLTGRKTYLALKDMVVQTGLDYEGRVVKVNTFFDQKDNGQNVKFLKEEKINFIYIPKAQLKVPVNVKEDNLVKVYENSEVLIFQVK